MKIYEHDCGHMTNMAAMPIYGKKPFTKISSLESVEQFQRNLVCSIKNYSRSSFVQIITLGWP